MIQLLYTVISAEAALILLFLFKTPLRKLVIMGVDKVKRGRGPVVAKTVAGTVFIVLLSSVYSMAKIQNRSIEAGGVVNPTDQVIMARHLLEASLMGFSLFLALMIDRLHHYIRELRLLRKSMETIKKQSRAFEDVKSGNSEEAKGSEEEINGLLAKVKQLESDIKEKEKEVENAEASVSALKKQSEGFLMEYDRLQEDNQNLRNQLQSIDQQLPHSDSKKSS
ncbi:hypothetical protein Syun_010002 [Stephania yunnanensis]|uniref:Endoplasmic reticulum transmembrane protein n=1 Tax=Stephania yunnanensis TaxID=152371 RepID=A0AAP0KFL6_9MAGN